MPISPGSKNLVSGSLQNNKVLRSPWILPRSPGVHRQCWVLLGIEDKSGTDSDLLTSGGCERRHTRNYDPRKKRRC